MKLGTSLLFIQVLRNGRWQEEDAAVLVPGDIISIKLGDIIPADSRLLEGDSLKIDQASTFHDHFYLNVFDLYMVVSSYLASTVKKIC